MPTIHHPSPFTSLPSADKNGFWVEAEIKAMQRSNGMGSHSPPLNCLPFLSNVWTESSRDKCCAMNLTPFLKETNQRLDDKLVTLVAEVHIEWNQHIFRVRISLSYFHGLNQHNHPKALRVYDQPTQDPWIICLWTEWHTWKEKKQGLTMGSSGIITHSTPKKLQVPRVMGQPCETAGKIPVRRQYSAKMQNCFSWCSICSKSKAHYRVLCSPRGRVNGLGIKWWKWKWLHLPNSQYPTWGLILFIPVNQGSVSIGIMAYTMETFSPKKQGGTQTTSYAYPLVTSYFCAKRLAGKERSHQSD